MEPIDRPETLIVPTAGRRPNLDELRVLEYGWTEPALAQLIAAAEVADRWLAENPAEASRFFRDPAAVIAELVATGALTGPVDDLLAILSSRAPAKAGKPERVRFAAESGLRSKGNYPPGETGAR